MNKDWKAEKVSGLRRANTGIIPGTMLFYANAFFDTVAVMDYPVIFRGLPAALSSTKPTGKPCI